MCIRDRSLVAKLTPSIRQLIVALSNEKLQILRLRYGEESERVDWKTVGRIIGCNADTAKRKRDRMRDRIKKSWIPNLLADLTDLKDNNINSQILYMSLIDGLEYETIEKQLKLGKGTVKQRVKTFSESFLGFAAQIVHVDTSDNPVPMQTGVAE